VTIENPIAIYGSNEYNNRDVYFSEYGDNELYIKVVVALEIYSRCSVVAAFLQKGIRGNINREVLKYARL
jgi:hypothetical protein